MSPFLILIFLFLFVDKLGNAVGHIFVVLDGAYEGVYVGVLDGVYVGAEVGPAEG